MIFENNFLISQNKHAENLIFLT